MILHHVGLAKGHDSVDNVVLDAVGPMINQPLAALVELAGQGSMTGCMTAHPTSWTEPTR